MAVALLALFVALGGTAVAAAPPVKRALFAQNAGKLQGKTVKQIAAMPGPTNSVVRLLVTRTADFALAADEQKDVSVSCRQGRALSGGFSSPGTVTAADSRISDPQTYSVYLVNGNATAATSVTVQVVCIL
ncbi:MAG: hypothetical protein ABR583_14390 [Gaiellaceae bacterium]